MSKLLFPLAIVTFWAAGSLVLLLPVIGEAWIVAHLTDLALAEACLVTFLHIAILIYLLQTYLASSGLDLVVLVLVFSAASLIVATVEGLLVHTWTDLSLFQATIVTSGTTLLIAYIFAHSVTGSIPSFLRGTFLQDIDADVTDDEMVDLIDQETFSPPRRKPSRRRKRKR